MRGAKFWLSVVTEIKNRGVESIYIACVDGLKGFGEAINAVFPKTTVQRCIVHMVRNSLNYVPWKDKKVVAADLKHIYTAANEVMAKEALIAFRSKWDNFYPTIADSWERNWQEIIPFLAFPEGIRQAIYTTNAIEAANRQIRKILKTKGSFTNDEAVFKLVFLALQNAQKKWTMPIRDWKLALNQFMILYAN
jgi:putative transposase